MRCFKKCTARSRFHSECKTTSRKLLASEAHFSIVKSTLQSTCERCCQWLLCVTTSSYLVVETTGKAAAGAGFPTEVPSSRCASPEGKVMPLSVKPSLFVPMPTIWAYGLLHAFIHDHMTVSANHRLYYTGPSGWAKGDQGALSCMGQ